METAKTIQELVEWCDEFDGDRTQFFTARVEIGGPLSLVILDDGGAAEGYFTAMRECVDSAEYQEFRITIEAVVDRRRE